MVTFFDCIGIEPTVDEKSFVKFAIPALTANQLDSIASSSFSSPPFSSRQPSPNSTKPKKLKSEMMDVDLEMGKHTVAIPHPDDRPLLTVRLTLSFLYTAYSFVFRCK